MGKLTQKSKAFDDLTLRCDSARAAFSVSESRMRVDVSMARAENVQLRAQIKRSNEEVVKVAKDAQTTRGTRIAPEGGIDDLEGAAASGDFKCDPKSIING